MNDGENVFLQTLFPTALCFFPDFLPKSGVLGKRKRYERWHRQEEGGINFGRKFF